MKRINLVFVVLIAIVFAACSNKDAEKKIAELESRLAEVETKTTPKPDLASESHEPEVKPEGPLPEITFVDTEHDFGTINEGDVVEHTFKFENTGEAPLIIQNATGSCGCTVPKWTNEPIQPGETGEIVAKFNSQGRRQLQNKTVTVTANTWPKQSTLKIRAMVTPKGEDAAEGPVRK